MKNGFFKTLTALTLGLSLTHLSGCATLFELSEEEGDYDRGYVAQEEYDEGACAEGDCHTDTDSGYAGRRSLAAVGDAAQGGDDYEGNRVRRAIQTRDVILGMTRQDVMESWGEPSQREVAGRGHSGHERWTYGSRYTLGEARTVIFENGKVAGWQR